MNEIFQYSPIVLIVIVFLLKQKIVVTPEQLERKHREIMELVESRFASNQSVFALKEQLLDMKNKVDKIYDHIISS